MKVEFHRFANFNDAVLLSVALDYREDGQQSAAFVLTARDWTDEADVWRSVRVVLDGVVEYRLSQSPRTTSQVLSDGLHMLRFGETVGLDIGGLVDAPTSVEELRRSPMYIVGRSLRLELVE